jgi:hypothetical protein
MADKKDDKRRLKLLNEVLPKPTVGQEPHGPRARTLTHMQRLLALAAASATLGSGCPDKSPGSGYGVVDPIPSPPTAPVPPASAITSATASATAPPTATAPPPPTYNPGYGVVDPMPPPPPDGGRRRWRGP